MAHGMMSTYSSGINVLKNSGPKSFQSGLRRVVLNAYGREDICIAMALREYMSDTK